MLFLLDAKPSEFPNWAQVPKDKLTIYAGENKFVLSLGNEVVEVSMVELTRAIAISTSTKSELLSESEFEKLGKEIHKIIAKQK